jgi:branched-chain amino acid transport system substrate-binding protein
MRRLSSTCLGIAAALLMCSAGDSSAPAYAAELSNNIVRVGILTDMSGSYSDISGPGAVEAAKMAVEDFGGTMFGVPIEVVVAIRTKPTSDWQRRANGMKSAAWMRFSK